MPQLFRHDPNDAASVLAFVGEGWRYLPGQTTAVPADHVVDQRVCTLPSDPPAAQDEAHATLRWLDDTLARGLLVAGYIGYEVGAALELIVSGGRTRQVGALPPDAVLYAFPPHALTAQLSDAHAQSPPNDLPAPAVPHTLSKQRESYIAAVTRSLEAIASGRYYQLNLSVACEIVAPTALDRLDLATSLTTLVRPQPVPFGMALKVGPWRLFSLSMERFLATTSRHASPRLAWTRPIKGTAPRGKTPAADAAQRAALRLSAKECAENAMIVDMARNDLARVAEIGSVTVPSLLDTVPYRTLWHLESEVRARLPPACSAGQLLGATLPPASVTGCPKVSAMTAIARLEQRHRGPYCGTLGVWYPDGRSDLSVGIRGVLQHGARAWLNVGSGIVADSIPAAEWQETCLKAQAALRGLAQLSTTNPSSPPGS
ncbi:MAG: anthranilate synthase component I family protein [Myxococcales bacterium]|nr:anthranilate synthase component I family protein [Myxococcales bacterium]